MVLKSVVGPDGLAGTPLGINSSFRKFVHGCCLHHHSDLLTCDGISERSGERIAHVWL